MCGVLVSPLPPPSLPRGRMQRPQVNNTAAKCCRSLLLGNNNVIPWCIGCRACTHVSIHVVLRSYKRVKGRNESTCTHTNPMQPASHRGSHTRTDSAQTRHRPYVHFSAERIRPRLRGLARLSMLTHFNDYSRSERNFSRGTASCDAFSRTCPVCVGFVARSTC